MAAPAAAQQPRGGDAQDGAGGAAEGGLQEGVGIDLGVSAEDAFAGGVQREGAIGSATTMPGATATSPAGAGGLGGVGGGLGGFGGGFGGLGGFGGFGTRPGTMGETRAEEPAIRTRLRSAVEVAPRSPEQVERRAAATLNRVSSRNPGRYPNVRVEMQGETAVLDGAVDRREDRRMSALLMMLEPGVSDVDNRIRVRP